MIQVNLPSTIQLKRPGEEMDYEKYAISFTDDESFGSTLPEENVSLHAYVAIKTFEEWVEIDNEEVRSCTSDINRAVGCSIVLYRKLPNCDKKNYPRWSAFA